MYKLKIDTTKGLHVDEMFVSDQTCVIGKKPENKVVLHGWGISKEHAKLSIQDGAIFVEDLQSRTGTKVNGNKVDQYGPLSNEDVIEINNYHLRVYDRRSTSSSNAIPTNGSVAKVEPAKPEPGQMHIERGEFSARDAAVKSELGPAVVEKNKPQPTAEPATQAINKELSQHALDMHKWRVRLRKGLHEQMDLRRIDVSTMSDKELRDLTTRLVADVARLDKDLKENAIPDTIDKDLLIEQVVAEAVGLGPLEPLIDREDISEIMVNCAKEVFYECAGRITKSDVIFTDDQAVQSIIDRIVAPIGRRIDESSPMVDARLKDGSRVNAVIPPLALKGPSLTIRKFMKERLTGQHLMKFGSVSQTMIDFLEVAVRTKQNVIISGGTGSGKTTLLNVLSNFIPASERIVTIEDSAELRLYQPNLVSMEARPPNQEGSGAITIRDLVRNSLRMRPDRIVVGECRGGEALDMLQAMNTGHDGSLSTVHANSARDCLSRLEVMVMMSGMDLPVTAIREQVCSAVNLIVQQTRFPCGTRKITGVSEVVGMESGRIQLAEVFNFQQTGYDEDGRVQGHFKATGLIPEFYESLAKRGIDVDLSVFQTEGEP